MRKITGLKVLAYRKLSLKFDDGKSGVFEIKDTFKHVAESLNVPEVFATAKIIDDGFGIGFNNCDYDICAQHAYASIIEHEYSVAE